MMTNGEKYKTAQECAKAYCQSKMDTSFLDGNFCEKFEQFLAWLELEADDENLLPCYMCGSNRITSYKAEVGYSLICRDCGYCAGTADTREEIEVKHNRVAKKCREVKA